MNQPRENQPSSADAFRRRFEEDRARRGEDEAFPMTFAGYPCRVRALSLLFFIRAGRVPEYFVLQGIARDDGGPAPPPPSTAELVAGEVFMRRAFCAVMVEPRVVESEPAPEGAYLYADLEETAPRFVEDVHAWIKKKCPRPEGEKGEGVLGVEDLEHFPEGAGGQPGVDAGTEGADGGASAVGAASANRKRAGRK